MKEAAATGLAEPESEHSEKFTTYRPKQVAEILGVSERTLTNWRHEGIGPAYVHIGRPEGQRGGRVLYEAGAIRAYLDANTVATDVTGLRAPKHKRQARRSRKDGAR